MAEIRLYNQTVELNEFDVCGVDIKPTKLSY